jgi:hypothetical protein
MRNLSTIGLISAAAAFSFLCASLTQTDGSVETTPTAIMPAR